MKAYITKSFGMTAREVGRWVQFFESHGVNLKIKEISIIPVFYSDNKMPVKDEVGFDPVLIGKSSDDSAFKTQNKTISYDDYFRIEDMFVTGKYRWKVSEFADIYEEKEIEKLSSAMVVVMLEEWSAHMRKDHIVVKWELIK